MRVITMKAPAPTEKEVQANFMRRLREMGFLVVRINSGAHRGKAGNYFRAYSIPAMPQKYQSSGLPDLMAMRDGKVIFFEMKTASGKLSEAQKIFQELAARHGMTVYTVYGMDGVDEICAKIERNL